MISDATIQAIVVAMCTALPPTLVAWGALRQGKRNGAKADGIAVKAAEIEQKADAAKTSCERVETATDTQHQLVTQSLGTLQVGTEAVRSQSNGNTDKLLDTIRHLTSDLNTARIESAIAAATAATELSALKEANGKEIAALTTEVNGLRTQRTGGRSTDVKPLVPVSVTASP